MKSRYRWFVVFVFFMFMLLHQADRLLIGPLTTPVMEAFRIDEAQMGAVFTGALVIEAVFYPLWGYLYDRYARSKLLALASFIWGSTTWLSAIAPTYPAFLATLIGLDARLVGSALANEITLTMPGARPEAWQVDGITGATVSSRAVVRAVNASAATLAVIHEAVPVLEAASPGEVTPGESVDA